MANNNLASYSSAWDIDQLIDSNEIQISVGAGSAGSPTIATKTINVANVNFPDCKATFKGAGQSVWHQAYVDQTGWDQNDISGNAYWPGLQKTNGVTVEYRINQNSVDFVVCNTGPSQTVTVRYYIWGETIIW